ncbi:MAG: hypothetical protein VB934_04760 [Polyangiaceae bacterium]
MEYLRVAGLSAARAVIPAVVLCTLVMSDMTRAETPLREPNATETFGLSEEQRKEAFREALVGEERATKEASEQHRDDPDSMKQVEDAMRLTSQYQEAAAHKFGITPKQLVLIVAEGYEKGWSIEPSATKTKELD